MRNPTESFHQEESDDEAKTLIATIYGQIRNDILVGTLPPNEKLRIEQLRNRYKVGAGTVREALGFLVSEALVVNYGQRGFRVASMTIENFQDITQVRIKLETDAIRSSVKNGGDKWETNLVSAFHWLTQADKMLGIGPGDTFEVWERCNRDFHMALISECRSLWTRHFLDILWTQSERYRRTLRYAEQDNAHLADEHLAIYEAALARKAGLTAKLVAEHIRNGSNFLAELADKKPTGNK